LFGPTTWNSAGLETISTDVFQQALARGKPVYDRYTLRRYVEEDSRLIDEMRPDVIVGDFRISLSVSARKAKLPYINITNAYWSPYASPDWVAPVMPVSRYLGPRASSSLFRAVRPVAFAAHAKPLNDVRKLHGFTPLPSDVRYAYTDGDVTLYADLPGLIPLRHQPPSHRQLGPVHWSPTLSMPSWWDNLPDGRGLVYVNLGSSGQLRLLPAILDALASEHYIVVVATAGRSLDIAKRNNVYEAPFLDGAAFARRAVLVVCNGGSPATQQAILSGAPVLGIPSNLDQFLNMGYVERAGLGISCRADEASVTSIRACFRRVVDDPKLLQAAASISQKTDLEETDRAFRSAIASLYPA
jgi:UDP:flavonoid glycosyltransferase YjiC (YdhE family)